MHADPTFWNNLAEQYAARPVPDPTAFERKIDITKQHLSPESVVLDVGCGTGSLALILAPHAAHVHGLDLSSEMMRIADEKAEAQGIDNVSFHTAPLDDLSAFSPQSIDVLCAYNILHLVPDRVAVLRRLYDLVRPGGTFISSTLCLGDDWIPYRPMLTVMRWVGKAPYVAVMRQTALHAELTEAGFTDLTTPDVGAKSTVAFVVARRPA